MHLINIGFGNMLAVSRVVVILSEPSSSSSKRLKNESDKRGRLIDATQGKKTRSIVVTDSDHVILSAVKARTITQRLEKTDA